MWGVSDQNPRVVTAPSPGRDFDAFYLREFAAMTALAAAVTGTRLGAEDVAQEALARAYRHWERVSGYDKPGTWLRRVTINLALSARHRLAREGRLWQRLAGEPAVMTEEDPHQEVWEAVRRLPGKQRAAVALHYLEDRSVAEVAEILGCAEATARVHLHRGREALAGMLEESR